MQRIAVAVQPVEQGLVLPGRDIHGEVGLAFGHNLLGKIYVGEMSRIVFNDYDSTAVRWALDTAMARSLPDWTWPWAPATAV